MLTISNLQDGLGEYRFAREELPSGGLTLHDLGELFRRVGISAGFVVESEYKVEVYDRDIRKIDWVWIDPKCSERKPTVAIEIEGRDVGNQSIHNDLEKFRACNAPLNIIALFQVDHNLTPKGPSSLNKCREYVKIFCDNTPLKVEVFLDAELFSDEGIKKITESAQKLVNTGGKGCEKTPS